MVSPCMGDVFENVIDWLNDQFKLQMWQCEVQWMVQLWPASYSFHHGGRTTANLRKCHTKPAVSGDQLWQIKEKLTMGPSMVQSDHLKCHKWSRGPPAAAITGPRDRLWGTNHSMTGPMPILPYIQYPIDSLHILQTILASQLNAFQIA